jgi:ribonuclease D
LTSIVVSHGANKFDHELLDCNIISADAITSIVDAVPTTVEELAALAVLQEQTLQDYGDRLLRYIARFMIDENLDKNTKNRIVLSYEETKKLEERIKNLAFIWAQEEQLLGNTSIFCKF